VPAGTLDSIPERYLLLALRLGRHLDALVDGYFGPPEIQAIVNGEKLTAPAALGEEAALLLAELDQADDDPQRLRWLRGQLQGLACVAELAGGTEVPWHEAVQRCYGLNVELMPEERLARVHERLDAALPGNGNLGQRLQAWNRSQEVPADKLLPAFHALADELRQRTAAIVDLAEGERVDAETVADRPWAAYNWYLGNGKSRIELNTDLPMRSWFLAQLVAHEAYPGHHTEHSCKETRLFQQLGRPEASILIIHTPECLVSEGIAQVAIRRALGDDWDARVAELLEPLEIPFDKETARAVVDAHDELEAVGTNVAYLTNEHGWSTEQAVAYHEHWSLLEEHRARKRVEFDTHPLWSIYVPTYSYGRRLVQAYADQDDRAFTRLLTEQLTTADLV
jgi:hypothetical protein